MDKSKLETKLYEIAESWGADLFGIADLNEARQPLEEVFHRSFDYPRAICVGKFFPEEVVSGLFFPGGEAAYKHYYHVLNRRLDDVALDIYSYLNGLGYNSLPVPASQRIPGTLRSAFSHRAAASLAGIGWIGRHCSIVTPQRGPRVRLTTILTSAELNPGSPLKASCGECYVCVEVCPVKALKKVPFKPEDPLEDRFDAKACEKFTASQETRVGFDVCGLCIASCPVGRPGGKAK